MAKATRCNRKSSENYNKRNGYTSGSALRRNREKWISRGPGRTTSTSPLVPSKEPRRYCALCDDPVAGEFKCHAGCVSRSRRRRAAGKSYGGTA